MLDYLKGYYQVITSQKSEIDKNLEDALKKYDPDNVDQYAEVLIQTALQDSLHIKVKASKRALGKPYFSRVNFKANGEKTAASYYIGKMSVIRDGDASPLVVDWRAPAASLYYDGRIGPASYECPEGIINGEIFLKRQYVIENGVLNDFFDIDITTNDEFLQAALGSSKDRRLKDIVTTIQAEQNRIIRADMHKPVIVQGAAGGGKTTIALHRIAYLLYTYEERLSPRNVMIIAPNRFFLSYISDVLPDLGVENVVQTTFEDFAADFLEKKLKIKPADEKLAYLLQNPNQFKHLTDISKTKSSLAFKDAVGRFVKNVTEELIQPKDYALGEYVLIKFEEIKRLFNVEYSFLPVSKRLGEIKKHLVNILKKRRPEIVAEINAGYDKQLDAIKRILPEDTPERRAVITELLDKRDEELSFIAKKAPGLATEYIKRVKVKKADEYYRDFLSGADMFMRCCDGLIGRGDAENAREHSLGVLGSGWYEIEDLAPIMYIHYAFYGDEGFDLRHIVIDEAQDVSLFQTYILRLLMKTNSFTILGDLCQGIYSYRGIADWNDVSEQVFTGDSRLMTLEQSYRTTVEIMDFANTAARKLDYKNVPEAKPVIRHGSLVTVRVMVSFTEIVKEIDLSLAKFTEKGFRSAAVICKTADECRMYKKLLKTPGISVFTGRENDYGGGTVIVPAYLAKGLEFDGVIIADAGAERYGDSETDVKLLYVAMTRALHELAVFAKDELTEILR